MTARTEPTGRATIYDVARLAGVSHQTVARRVRGDSNVNEEMRARIDAAIAKLGYRPNLSARSLATRRSRLLGAIVSETSELGPSREVQGAIVAARDAGYTLDVVTMDPSDPENYRAVLTQLEAKDVEGILVQASTDQLREAALRHSSTIPTVIDHADETERDFAGIDALGTSLVVEHLIGLGHRDFHYVAGPANWVSARIRERSFERTLTAHGITTWGRSIGDWSARSGYQRIRDITTSEVFTAIVVANDQMALGVMRALSERGLRVPDDVSVTGFDDLADSEFYLPPLTTVNQDPDRQGRFAIGRLLQLIGGTPEPPPPLPEPLLVTRASTATPPKR